MSFTETIAAGRAFVESGEPLPRANRELLATGLANAGGAFLGAMVAGGGTTQTAVNRRAGGTSDPDGASHAATRSGGGLGRFGANGQDAWSASVYPSEHDVAGRGPVARCSRALLRASPDG